MLRDIVVTLVTTFVIDPVAADLRNSLAAARAPQAVVRDIADCAGAATPALADRVLGDPWWGVTTAVGIWVGTTTAERALGDVAPACRAALDAARPFLSGREA